MFDAQNDPEQAERDFGPTEVMPYTVEGYRKEIVRLNRRIARIQNLVRMAHGLSSENKVTSTLQKAMEA